jgi:hypothetical protein
MGGNLTVRNVPHGAQFQIEVKGVARLDKR